MNREDATEVVQKKVNALPDLTDEQRAQVVEICVAYVQTHDDGTEPHYGNLAHLVRSRRELPAFPY